MEASVTQKTQALEQKMNSVLRQLSVPLVAVWTPNPNQQIHGEIKGEFLLIYDESESEAWQTFTHEIVEWKLSGLTGVYRTVINTLIEALEKTIYVKKEELIEFLPKLFEAVKENR
jgi:hypothetical protein